MEAPSLANGPLNDRTEYNDSQVQRGSIVTADGVTIASSKATNDASGFKYQRTYSDGPVYAPVTGYDTVFTAAQAPNYATGVERAENSLLSGTGDQLAFRNFIDMITDKPQKGATVEVTINSKAQQAAYTGLESTLAGKTINGVQQVGGVVALNPSTGAILAMASYPSYDPNELAVPNTQTAANLVSQLTKENPSPLLNNASQTTLPPGSTFKIVTTSTWYTDRARRTTPKRRSTRRSRSSCRTATSSTTTATSRAATTPGRRRSSPRSPSPATPRSPTSACSSAARRSSRWPTSTASTPP